MTIYLRHLATVLNEKEKIALELKFASSSTPHKIHKN